MMKRILVPVLFLLALLCTPLQAQSAHSVSLSWVASTTTGVAGYNVYRAPCSGTVTAGVCGSGIGTFGKVNAALVGTSYTDNTVAAGGKYVFYATAVCTTGCGTDSNGAAITGESGPSNTVAVSVPLDPVTPKPPSGLGITSVTQNINGANVTIMASYSDTPGLSTSYSVWVAGGRVLDSGVLNNSTGYYNVISQVKVKPGTSIYFSVCDSNAVCASQKAA
jgi:hypothetical protein